MVVARYPDVGAALPTFHLSITDTVAIVITTQKLERDSRVVQPFLDRTMNLDNRSKAKHKSKKITKSMLILNHFGAFYRSLLWPFGEKYNN